MANDVFANGREISCKKADGKTICCFPDVCMTPPENPVTPPGVPVPYPNTAFAKDTSNGSKTVKITGEEVILKNKSFFKTSTGDEAGCAAKKGVMTSKIKGKAYFIAWSMDVKFEGENVVRHLDMTTHNHGSNTNTAPWMYADRIAIAEGLDDCNGDRGKVEAACKVDRKGKVKCPCGKNAGAIKRAKAMPKGDKKNTSLKKAFNGYAECMKGDKCQKAAKCMLTEKKPHTCCPPQTPHHIVPGSQFREEGGGEPLNKGVKGYKYDKAPCICVEGENQTQATHGAIHFETAVRTKEIFPPADAPFSGRERWKVGEAEDVGAAAVAKETGCDEKCIKAQVRKKHQEMGVKEDANIRPTAPGPVEHPENDTSL